MSSEKHEEIREKLLQIGEALGYESRSSFRKDAMGDAIWLDRRGKRFAGRSLPTVAFEVLTFETTREIRDCIMTLQIIGPALGILVIVEEEYAQRAQELVNYDAETYPEDSFDNMKEFARANGFTFPYLHDESQQVARAYDAVCTPDFFGFDADLGLQYRGRLDASRKEAGPEDFKRELYEAMKGVAETGQGPEDQIASMGCSIKWKLAG